MATSITSSRSRPRRAFQTTLERARRLTRDEQLVLAAMAVAVVLRLLPLGAYSAEYDEGVYWQSLRSMEQGHPLFTAVFSSQPPGFLLAIYPFYVMFGSTLAAGRFAVLLWSMLGFVGIYLAGRAAAGRWAGALAVALLAVDPWYLTGSHTLEADAPSVALAALAVGLAAWVPREMAIRRRRRLAIGSGVALAVGVLMKLFAIVALLPMLCYLLLPLAGTLWHMRHPGTVINLKLIARATRVTLKDTAYAAGGGLLVTVLIALPFAGSEWGVVRDQVITFHLAAARVYPGGLGSFLNTASGTIPLFVVALLACALAWRAASWGIVPALLWLAASVVLLERQRPLFPHHLVLFSVPLALTIAVALTRAIGRTDSAARLPITSVPFRLPLRRLAVALAAVVLVVGLIGGLHADATAVSYVPTDQLHIATAIHVLTVPGDLVATDDPYAAALAARSVPPELVDTSYVRIASGYLTTQQVENIITRDNVRTIVFATGRFEQLPGFARWVATHFTKVATFGTDEVMYQKLAHGPQIAAALVPHSATATRPA